MPQQRTAAALFSDDTDGQVSSIGHLDVIEPIADGDDTAGAFGCFLCLDGTHFRGGEGQYFQRKFLAFFCGSAMSVSGDDVNGQISGKCCQPGTDPFDDLTIFGDGAIVVQDQVVQYQFLAAGNFYLQHRILLYA